ncbi:MAG: hypothetical protein OXI97_06520, partial [Acidimicrobiaceae bacterium]|nr:hypothetical protein [Acidimicrobiaceae bacterium]
AGFDPRTAADSSCIVVWGANPSHSGPHMDQHWLGNFDRAVVFVDPIRTDTAGRADLHLQLLPELEPGGCNVNVLHEGNSADIKGCSAVHGTLVSLEPAR